MAESASFQILKDQYFMLEESFNRLFLACRTDEERDSLRRDYVNARDNFWEARNRVFSDNDPHVKSLAEELKTARGQIEGMLASLQDVGTLLQTITSAVRLGSSLITLGSVA